MTKYVVTIIKKNGEIKTINNRTKEDLDTLRAAFTILCYAKQA